VTPDGLVRFSVDFDDGSSREFAAEADVLTDPVRLRDTIAGDVAYEAWPSIEQGILPDVPRRLFRAFRADALDRLEFPAVRYIIRGVLPEGLAVLAGRPKIGKSWWTMGHAIDVASTGSPVLYLALEDPPRRLQSRMRTLCAGRPAPRALEFRTEWPRLDAGGLDALAAWLDGHPSARLVIIDTIAKVRPPRGRSEDTYLGDYGVWGALQALLLAHPGVAIIGNHHQRKGDADDVLDTILGSQGVAGAVDTVLVLRKSRGTADGELFVTGRDVEQEQTRALRFENGRWTDIGNADDFQRSQERNELVALLGVDGPLSIRGVADALGIEYDAARKRLTRAADAGAIVRRDGKYGVR
jgi:AAA domain